jgi:hypothetical protein
MADTETYVFRVSIPIRERVIKVEAQSRVQAEAAARDRMIDDIQYFAPTTDELRVEDTDEDAFDDDGDSIIAYETRDPNDYNGYDWAEDDPRK